LHINQQQIQEFTNTLIEKSKETPCKWHTRSRIFLWFNLAVYLYTDKDKSER